MTRPIRWRITRTDPQLSVVLASWPPLVLLRMLWMRDNRTLRTIKSSNNSLNDSVSEHGNRCPLSPGLLGDSLGSCDARERALGACLGASAAADSRSDSDRVSRDCDGFTTTGDERALQKRGSHSGALSGAQNAPVSFTLHDLIASVHSSGAGMTLASPRIE